MLTASEKNKQIARLWFEAFNAHDLEKLLALYDNRAQHYSPKLKVKQPETLGLIAGKNNLRVWWKEAFERLPDLRYEVKRLTADEEQVFMEYLRHTTNEEVLRVGEVLEIKNELIVFSRVYHG
jgi:limonene-1,2-epoxide hydrolase